MRLLLGILILTGSCVAMAEEFKTSQNYPAEYRKECGACHDPFPPRLMNKSDWAKIMAGLDHHFGTDATLEPNTTKRISQWLESNAGKAPPSRTESPRITETTWFKREHQEVSAATWTDPKIKTAANCSACHLNAATGSFRENEIRLPGKPSRREN